MKYAISEILELANEAWGKKRKIAALHEHSGPQLKVILDYCYNPNIKWLVDPDMKYDPCDDNLNSLRTRLFTEAASLNRFVNIGPYPTLNQKKRDLLFQTVLETIHPKDAELLQFIVKNRALPYNKLNKETIAEAFPILSQNWG
jgi:hypothetical protein